MASEVGRRIPAVKFVAIILFICVHLVYLRLNAFEILELDCELRRDAATTSFS